jgi:GPH family glycoside/pentoside/hexuronide:cation symporter
LKTLFRNPHFVTLLLIKITHLLAMSIGAGSLFFMFRFVLEADLQTLGIYGAVTTIVWAVMMPVWTSIARKHGKRYGYLVATFAYSIVTLSWLLADEAEPLYGTLVRGACFGVISGGMLLMGNAMLQDVMDEDYRRTGVRKNGMFAGSYSLIEKITSGIGAQILGVILSVSGFSRAAQAQPESALLGIYIVVAIIPAGLMLLSLFVIRAYRLDESKLGTSSI